MMSENPAASRLRAGNVLDDGHSKGLLGVFCLSWQLFVVSYTDAIVEDDSTTIAVWMEYTFMTFRSTVGDHIRKTMGSV